MFFLFLSSLKFHAGSTFTDTNIKTYLGHDESVCVHVVNESCQADFNRVDTCGSKACFMLNLIYIIFHLVFLRSSSSTHSQSRSSPRCFWAWRSPPGWRWRFVLPHSPSSRTYSSKPSPACLKRERDESKRLEVEQSYRRWEFPSHWALLVTVLTQRVSQHLSQ